MAPRKVTSVRQEIRQTRPFRSTAQEALLSLFRTADVAKRHVTRLLQPYGVTLQQYNVLRIVRGAGSAGHPTLEIAERMIEHQPGITRLLDRLEARGWVRRERSADDRRLVLCHISAEGSRLLERLEGPLRAGEQRAVAGLSPADQRRLVDLLDRLRSGAAEAETGG